jgi:alpha/beta superfamily hydrolase
MPEVLFAGPAGRLEGRYTPGKSPTAPVALILHPHPQHGGTMNNKVVYSLFNAFAERDFSTLRFNFRGVGRSQGTYDRGEGELCDAASALDWLQSINPNARSVWVAGFSFGAWIGMQLLMRRPEIHSYISVAPPANIYDFNFLAPCPNEGLIIQGDKDQVVNIESVQKLADKLKDQRGPEGVDYRIIPGAGHFFNNEGENEQLLAHINDYIARTIGRLRKAA